MIITLYELFSRSFTTQLGSDIMPGLVPEGARCGINMVARWLYISIVYVAYCVDSCVEIVSVYHDNSQPAQVLIPKSALGMG